MDRPGDGLAEARRAGVASDALTRRGHGPRHACAEEGRGRGCDGRGGGFQDVSGRC